MNAWKIMVKDSNGEVISETVFYADNKPEMELVIVPHINFAEFERNPIEISSTVTLTAEQFKATIYNTTWANRLRYVWGSIGPWTLDNARDYLNYVNIGFDDEK